MAGRAETSFAWSRLTYIASIWRNSTLWQGEVETVSRDGGWRSSRNTEGDEVGEGGEGTGKW